MNDVLGIDISIWNDDNSTPQMVDFSKSISSGAKFAFIKASQGNWADQDIIMNWNNAKLSGIPRGAYHFYDWRVDPITQARFFYEIIKNDPGELPPVLDYEMHEFAPINAIELAKKFVVEFEAISGLKMLIYTSPGYWREHGSIDPFWKEHKLWIANYNVPCPAIPLPWTFYTFWQFTSRGDGPTYGGEEPFMDLNYYKGTLDDFIKEFGLVTPPTEETYLNGITLVNLNVRLGPGVNYPITGSVVVGTPVKVGKVYSYGDLWGKIDENKWIAIKYSGRDLVRLV